MTVDELLAQARARLPHRPAPAEARYAQARGALPVDIRGDDQRRDGLIPGAIVVPRNSAATLQQLGLIHATDLDGGFTAWAAAGLPVIAPPAAGQDPSGNRRPDGSPTLNLADGAHDNECSAPASRLADLVHRALRVGDLVWVGVPLVMFR